VEPIQNVSGAARTSPESALDPSTILAYCASRLNAIDTLIRSRFAAQTKTNETLKHANELIDTLNMFPAGVAEGAGPDAKCANDHRHLAARLARNYNQATDPALRAKLADNYLVVTGKPMALENGFATATDPAKVELDLARIGPISDADWKLRIASVKTLQDSLSKDGELSMIELQSLVSQRQLAIQLTTQLMSAEAEGKRAIVANIKA